MKSASGLLIWNAKIEKEQRLAYMNLLNEGNTAGLTEMAIRLQEKEAQRQQAFEENKQSKSSSLLREVTAF